MMTLDSKFNFTVKTISDATCPPGRKQIRYMDTNREGANLGLRVTPSGSKMFIYYRCLPKDNESPLKLCEEKIGKVGEMTIEQARRKAGELNHIVGQGKDPSYCFI